MRILLLSIVGILFVTMLFVNLYFRAKVLRAYRVLVRNRVEFTAGQIFSNRKLEEEIIPSFPEQEPAIRDFSTNLKRSISMTTVLLALITLFGGILMWYRFE
jgi:hypothetical protein